MIPLNTSVVAGVVLSEQSGETKMLLMKRAKEGYWCQVAGKIEAGETAGQAMLRELKEETGIESAKLYNGEFLEQFYDAKSNELLIIPAFAILCPANQEVVLNEEHTEFRWCSLEQAKSLVPFPNQKQLYQHIWTLFVENTPSEHLRVPA